MPLLLLPPPMLRTHPRRLKQVSVLEETLREQLQRIYHHRINNSIIEFPIMHRFLLLRSSPHRLGMHSSCCSFTVHDDVRTYDDDDDEGHRRRRDMGSKIFLAASFRSLGVACIPTYLPTLPSTPRPFPTIRSIRIAPIALRQTNRQRQARLLHHILYVFLFFSLLSCFRKQCIIIIIIIKRYLTPTLTELRLSGVS